MTRHNPLLEDATYSVYTGRSASEKSNGRMRYKSLVRILITLAAVLQAFVLLFFFRTIRRDDAEIHGDVGTRGETIVTHRNGPVRNPTSSGHIGSTEETGTFNGFELHRKNGDLPRSAVHCIGEKFYPRNTTWIYRSCKFTDVCFDVKEKEFVLFQTEEASSLQRALEKVGEESALAAISSSLNTTVSLGSINSRWNWRKDGIPSLRWFPKIVSPDIAEKEVIYWLPDNAVLVPFHSMSGLNVGHLLWDDFLPIYTLLSLFDLHNQKGLDLVLMRYVLKGRKEGKGLWASCDWDADSKTKCLDNFKRWIGVMGTTMNQFSTTEDFRVNTSAAAAPKYICARRGVAGVGMLSDHGLKMHGWEAKDYEYTHNHGRGNLLLQYRNFMAENVQRQSVGAENTLVPVRDSDVFTIVFSTNSSSIGNRRLSFHDQIEAVKSEFASDSSVIVQDYVLSTHSVADQVRIISDASVLVTACGGGAVTSMFLPQGASLIVYYPEYMGAMLDWDTLNHMSYLRTHWLPLGEMEEKQNIDILVALLKHELATGRK